MLPYMGRSYRTRTDHDREYMREWTRKRRQETRQKIVEIKAASGCMRCGMKHPACLQFHHRNPEEKVFGINRFITKIRSFEKILAEIAKCDILCANCHAILHWDEE